MTEPHPEFVHIVLLCSFFISSHGLGDCDFRIAKFFCLEDLSVLLWLQVLAGMLALMSFDSVIVIDNPHTLLQKNKAQNLRIQASHYFFKGIMSDLE